MTRGATSQQPRLQGRMKHCLSLSRSPHPSPSPPSLRCLLGCRCHSGHVPAPRQVVLQARVGRQASQQAHRPPAADQTVTSCPSGAVDRVGSGETLTAPAHMQIYHHHHHRPTTACWLYSIYDSMLPSSSDGPAAPAADGPADHPLLLLLSTD